MFTLSPKKRRIVYVVIFEFFAIIFSTLLLKLLSNDDSHNSLAVAVMISAVAVVWNYIYNTIFEYVESKRGITERTVAVRVIHAAGFELGLFLVTIPLYMWWYNASFGKAISMEIAIMIFFLIYTYLFTWLFDTLVPRQDVETKDAETTDASVKA